MVEKNQQDSSFVVGKYTLIDIIGQGGFGLVFKATISTGEKLAAKAVVLEEEKNSTEVQILSGLNHPNILAFIEVV